MASKRWCKKLTHEEFLARKKKKKEKNNNDKYDNKYVYTFCK